MNEIQFSLSLGVNGLCGRFISSANQFFVFSYCVKNLREIRKTESLKIPTCIARPLLKVAIFIFATIVFKTRRYCIAQAPLTAVATHCFSILCILSPAIITILGFIIATCLECAQSCCLNYRVYQIC